MSSLIISRDSQILMLEVAIEKLFIPNSSPFDAVILSKFIVSFRFLDDEWIDIMPNRLDYKNYRGSSGEEQRFHGGKSIVLGVPESILAAEQKGLELEFQVRREISRYFEEDGLEHTTQVGTLAVNVDRLVNGIGRELRIRCELGDYLRLAHERDPISRSLRGKYGLADARPSSELELYVRLSHLGCCVVTEIDRPSRGALRHFYAQEEKNLGSAYECLELEPEASPEVGLPIATLARARPSLQLECECSEEQRHALLMDERSRTRGTSMDETRGEKDGAESKRKKKKDKKKEKDKERKKKKQEDKGVNTDAENVDTSVGTPGQALEDLGDGKGGTEAGTEAEKEGRKRKLEMDEKELMALLKKRRRGSGPMVYIEKDKPRKPTKPSDPCCAIVCELPCDVPCISMPICSPPIYCCE